MDTHQTHIHILRNIKASKKARSFNKMRRVRREWQEGRWCRVTDSGPFLSGEIGVTENSRWREMQVVVHTRKRRSSTNGQEYVYE